MTLIALLLASPIDEIVILSLFGRSIPMPKWLLILIALLLGTFFGPKLLSYAKGG